MKITATITKEFSISDIAPEVAEWSRKTNSPIKFQLSAGFGEIYLKCESSVLVMDIGRPLHPQHIIDAYDELRNSKVRLYEYTGVWSWAIFNSKSAQDRQVALAVFDEFIQAQRKLYPNITIVDSVCWQLKGYDRKVREITAEVHQDTLQEVSEAPLSLAP